MRGSLPRSKAAGDWICDRSSPSNAKDKYAWSYIFAVLYIFMAWCLIKTRGQIYLLYIPEHETELLIPETFEFHVMDKLKRM